MGENIITFIMLWVGLIFVLVLLEFPKYYRIKNNQNVFYSFWYLIKSCIFIPIFNMCLFLVFYPKFSLLRPYKSIIDIENVFKVKWLLILNIILILIFVIIYLIDLLKFKSSNSYIFTFSVRWLKRITIFTSLITVLLFCISFILINF